MEWAAFAIVHAAGGTVADYRSFVTLAAAVRRVLLIETTSDLVPDWAALLVRRKPRPLPGAVILPRGGLHPIAAGVVQ